MIHAVIIGASGYSGAELVRILSRHPDVSVDKVTAATSAGQRVDALYPALAGLCDLSYDKLLPDDLEGMDIAFVALPSGEAMRVVPELRTRGLKVIDLGGDFRLASASLYEQYYKRPHIAPALLAEAVYGLPELYRDAIRGAHLVANPGCYPTSALLALLPVVRHGVSGAGRSSSVEMSFAELNENVRAYKIGSHQHIPEIEGVLASAAGGTVSASFVPHLVPITRGIYTTVHASPAVRITEEELSALYEEYYAGHPFVRIKRGIPQIASVVRTNYCDIGLFPDERTKQIVVIATIDNLVKGAAGQATQNMNLMFGLPETAGL
jgi:N-acetyl-gamma-glutamyl-phosphate reductase